MIGRATKTATRLLAAVVTSALGLCVLELVFGTWLSSNPWDRALALNIIVDRHLTYDATDLYDDGGLVPYSRDRYGFRGSYGEPKDITILTIGGSTTDQRYIPDGSTWQDELQRRLRSTGKNASVANAGVDGHSTFGHLASYEYWFPLIPDLQPDYTILYVGINDFFVDAPSAAFEGSADGAKTVRSRIKANSALFRFYSLIRGTLLARTAHITHGAIDPDGLQYIEASRPRNDPAIDGHGLHAFEQRFEKLLQRVREHGSIPVCVTQPTLYYRRTGGAVFAVDLPIEVPGAREAINGVDYFHVQRARDVVMQEACAAAGGLSIDLASEEWEAMDFYDLVHTTPRGASKVGERIAEAMKTLTFRRAASPAR